MSDQMQSAVCTPREHHADKGAKTCACGAMSIDLQDGDYWVGYDMAAQPDHVLIEQFTALKLGLQQAITEMRDDRLTWGIHGKTLLIRQFEVLKLADRLELLEGLSETRGNPEQSGQVNP